MTWNDWLSLGASSGVLTTIGLFLRSALKTAITDFTTDISSHLTPNGGSSLYDQASEGREFAKKALEIAVAAEARAKAVEAEVIKLGAKLDAIILSSRLP